MKYSQTSQLKWFQRLAHRQFKLLTIPIAVLLMFHPLGLVAIASEPDFSGRGRPQGEDANGSSGSRGDCDFDITPLLPMDEQGGWTTQPNPTLWIQVPTELSTVRSVRLEVRDMSGRSVYRTRLTNLDAPAGIVRIPLPNTVQLPVSSPDATHEDGVFNWMIAMYCDDSGDRPAYASGAIRRVAVAGMSESTLAGKSSQEISDLYAQNGIWYDALTVLGDARLSSPNDPALNDAWQTLLSYSSVGLGAIANEPLVDCCTLPE